MDVFVLCLGVALCLGGLGLIWIGLTLCREPATEASSEAGVPLPHDLEDKIPEPLMPEVKDGIASIRNPHFGLQQAMTYAVKQADAGHSPTLVHGTDGGPIVVSYKKNDGDASIHARPATRREKLAGGDITVDTTNHPEPLVDNFDVYCVRQGRAKLPKADIAIEPGEIMPPAEMEARIRAWEKYSAQLDVDATKAAYADEQDVAREPRVSPEFLEFSVDMPKSAEA